MQQFCQGDLVSVEATVRYDTDDDANLFIRVGSYDVVADRSAATLIRPCLKIGQEVIADRENATIIAVHEQTAWIHCAGSGHRLVHITDLKRKEAEEPTP